MGFSLKSCCFAFGLRSGSLLIGVVSLIGFVALAVSPPVAYPNEVVQNVVEDMPFFKVFDTVLFVVGAVFSAALLFGIFTDSRPTVVTFVFVLAPISVIEIFLRIFYYFKAAEMNWWPLDLLVSLIYLYALCVVYSFNVEMKRGVTNHV